MFCSCPDAACALRLALRLVEEKLAACVQTLANMHSVYRWENKIEQTEECMLLIKTDSLHFETLRKRICSLHPYSVPEIIAHPILHAEPKYLQWMLAQLG
ncbi:MAG: divalent-cation tolerance protein CutA [Cystobacterineae bacterium]|nr:divalent-cation tolerance protein CutA [Cystobacterineae bacterium]MCL2258358.1 divalent-cation tolerance protein CutA [Cystobacterineae bacterium]